MMHFLGRKYLGGLLVLLGLMAAAGTQAAAGDSFVLVANHNNQVESLSRKDVALIFLSRKRSWSSGKNIAVVINENPKIYSDFTYDILKRSPRQYLFFRKKMLFRGQGMPPPSVQTDQEVINFITAHCNGLGYVSPQALTPEVRAIPIVD
ncbi:MAG: hypothetical protein C0613_00820 [Desulfobulbaceae bacterium]|nr:MAG: hypothetical protein C0613_00820 [Desulfobulbaceae bacterium]